MYETTIVQAAPSWATVQSAQPVPLSSYAIFMKPAQCAWRLIKPGREAASG